MTRFRCGRRGSNGKCTSQTRVRGCHSQGASVRARRGRGMKGERGYPSFRGLECQSARPRPCCSRSARSRLPPASRLRGRCRLTEGTKDAGRRVSGGGSAAAGQPRQQGVWGSNRAADHVSPMIEVRRAFGFATHTPWHGRSMGRLPRTAGLNRHARQRGAPSCRFGSGHSKRWWRRGDCQWWPPRPHRGTATPWPCEMVPSATVPDSESGLVVL